jgi:phytanoyl-CoA hydroxylase
MTVIKPYASALTDYKENGFCKIDSMIDRDTVNEFIKQIDLFLSEKKDALSGRDINLVDGQVNSVHCLHQSDNYFTQFANSAEVKDLAAYFLEETSEFRGAELFAKPAKVGMASPFHQDDYYWCVQGHNALTFWVALDECNEENGGLTYFRGSHKLGLLPHQDSNAPGSSQMIADSQLLKSLEREKMCIPVKPGDCLIHHSLTIHGSAPNTSERSRRGFTMQFKAEAAAYDQQRLKHYEQRLQSQVESRREKS